MRTTNKLNDRARRSADQQMQIGSRVSESTHQKLTRIAKKNKRSIGAQAALFIEEGVQRSSAA